MANNRFKVDHGLAVTGNSEFYQRIDAFANAYFNNDLVLVTGNLTVSGNLNYANVSVTSGGIQVGVDQAPLGNTSNRFNLFAYKVEVYGSIVPSANGIQAGNTTRRFEVFANSINVADTINLPGGQVINSTIYTGTASNANTVGNLAANGIIVRTGTATAVARTITTGTAGVTITNGNGVSGNPSVDITFQNGLFSNSTGVYVNASSIGDGTLPITRGGTGGPDRTTALNNLLPAQSIGVADYVLRTDGTNASWVLATGPTGFSGSRGFTGSVGASGGIGFTGSQGIQGFSGSVGYSGSVGSAGYWGSTGAAGYWGSVGYSGSQGIQGFTGSNGFWGSVGAQGGVGFTGSAGYWGSSGAQGFTGSQGATGTGTQGAVGFTGSAGTNGTNGTQGFTGSQGATGTGSQGATGFTGSVGATGFTGSGYSTTASIQMGSLGVGTAASGTSGEIRATNEITAYYSSDRNLKTNIIPIENALDKIRSLSGVMFDWTDEYIEARGGEDGYFVRKHDTGVIAQDVQSVLPEVVATREDGTLAVKYEKMMGLVIQAINELAIQVDEIKQKVS